MKPSSHRLLKNLLAEDVATKLTQEIHKYTDIFSDVFTITSMVNASNVSTITTSTNHGCIPGDAIFISDVAVPISISSATRTGVTGHVTTSIDHDLTEGVDKTITISGSSSANFNGTFTIVNIANRRNFTFTMVNSGDTSSTGGSVLNAERYDQAYNGLYNVATVTSPTVLTVSNASNIDATVTSGKLKKNLRISASANMARTMDSYTKQNLDKAWMFSVLGDVTASKSRRSEDDFTANQTRHNYFRQQLGENVTLYVIANTPDEIAGRRMRDEMDQLLVSITKSIAFYKFPTNLHVTRSEPIQFVRHGVAQYDGATYVHEFEFECVTDLLFEDTVGYDNDVAFRDIEMEQTINFGTKHDHANSDINLDEEAL